VEVLDYAMRVGAERSKGWSQVVARLGVEREKDRRVLRMALRQRKVPHLRCHWAGFAAELVRDTARE
jgi:hypothetical protein